MNFSAVILAGGESRRMGCDKAFVQKDGRSLLERAVAVAREAGADEVFVSGRRGADYTTVGCPVLLDVVSGEGPVAGIERGLDAAHHDLVLVLAVDMPNMDAVLVRHLLSECDVGIGIVPRVNGYLEPLAAFYPQRSHDLAVEFLQTSSRAAREFAERCARAGKVRWLDIPERFIDGFVNWNDPS